MMRDIISSTTQQKTIKNAKEKNTTRGPNTEQPKIWRDFDLLVEGKKGEISLMTLILSRVSDFDNGNIVI